LIRRLALLMTGLAAIVATSPALAAAKEDYMAACMKASSDDTELCTCKTEQAVKLVDEEMLGYLVTALADPAKFSEMIDKGEVPQKVVTKWPFYVRDSNKVCLAPE
jgi:hypothetical protein